MRSLIAILSLCLLSLPLFPAPQPGSGPCYFTANEGGSITRIDAASNKVVKTLALDGVIHNVQISPDGNVLGAVMIPRMASDKTMSEMEGSALFFDANDDHLIKKVPVGRHPAHIVFTQNGQYALVTNSADNSVSVIDAKTYEVKRSVPTGRTPHGFRISRDSRYAYVANMGEDTVSVIDLLEMREKKRIRVGKVPVTTGVTSDGKTLAVTLNAGNAMAVVNLATESVTTIGVGQGPAQLFVAPDDRSVFVANQGTETSPSNSVSKIDLATRTVVATIIVGKGAHGLVTDRAGKRVYVTNMFDNTVSVIDNAGNQVIATVPVGRTPSGITYKD